MRVFLKGTGWDANKFGKKYGGRGGVKNSVVKRKKRGGGFVKCFGFQTQICGTSVSSKLLYYRARKIARRAGAEGWFQTELAERKRIRVFLKKSCGGSD